PADLRNRSGSSAGPECENVDRSHSPPHASGSRPGSPETLLSAQRNPNDFSGYRPDAIFQNWLILNSRRSGGLSLVNPAEGQYVGNMDKWDPSGTQRYAGMTLNVERKASRGMSMNANWTWSHCTGYFQGYNTKTDQTVTVVN